MLKNKLLTKSNYLIGLQCPKYLWTKFNDAEKIPEYDAATLQKFEEGHSVGELAKKFFSGGISIPTEDFMANIKKTKELISQRKVLYEAGILKDTVYSRIDILKPTGDDEWDIIEVKSSTKVKPQNLDDVSFQKHCCEQFGLKIKNCFLMYVNNKYIKEGEINPKGFFSIEEITAEADASIQGIQQRINDMFSVIDKKNCPNTSIGKHCNAPYDCPLKEYCWEFLPVNNVFDLYYGGDKSQNLFEKGIYAIKDIPANVKLTERQGIQKECELARKHYIRKEEIESFLDNLSYPLNYLDFETFDPCIPIFEGTHPYQKIPFQFSLHVVKDEDSEAEHFYFLAEGINDPRPKLLFSLKKVLGDNGSIVVYNQVFEKNVLKELAEAFPDYKEWIENVSSRIVDLFEPFKDFDYYHPGQKGSASIKNVLPVLTEKNYEGMSIGNGEEASLAFIKANFSDVSEEEKNKIIEALKHYCCLDTEGMLLIIKKLRQLTC